MHLVQRGKGFSVTVTYTEQPPPIGQPPSALDPPFHLNPCEPWLPPQTSASCPRAALVAAADTLPAPCPLAAAAAAPAAAGCSRPLQSCSGCARHQTCGSACHATFQFRHFSPLYDAVGISCTMLSTIRSGNVTESPQCNSARNRSNTSSCKSVSCCTASTRRARSRYTRRWPQCITGSGCISNLPLRDGCPSRKPCPGGQQDEE